MSVQKRSETDFEVDNSTIPDEVQNYVHREGIHFDLDYGLPICNFIFWNLIFESLDTGKKSVGIFLDIAKAFDSESHDILLIKLKKILGFNTF